MVLPTMARGVFGASLVFVWNGAQGERFNFCFSRVFASINKAFILAGGLGAGLSFILWGMDTFLIFPNFASLLPFGNWRGNSYIPRL